MEAAATTLTTTYPQPSINPSQPVRYSCDKRPDGSWDKWGCLAARKRWIIVTVVIMALLIVLWVFIIIWCQTAEEDSMHRKILLVETSYNPSMQKSRTEKSQRRWMLIPESKQMGALVRICDIHSRTWLCFYQDKLLLEWVSEAKEATTVRVMALRGSRECFFITSPDWRVLRPHVSSQPAEFYNPMMRFRRYWRQNNGSISNDEDLNPLIRLCYE